MIRLMTKHSLLLIACFLATVKFIVFPVFDWQASAIDERWSNSNKLRRYESVIDAQSDYEARRVELSNVIKEQTVKFYDNSEATKLNIQKAVESIFVESGVALKRFSWVSDRNGSVRVLRAGIDYDGNYEHVVKALWALSRNKKLIRQVQTENRYKWVRSANVSLQLSSVRVRGSLVLEFYLIALEQSSLDITGIGEI